MDLQLKKGQKISIEVYKGNSIIAAKSLASTLENKMNTNESITFNNKTLEIDIKNVECFETVDFRRDCTVYKIILEGEIK